MKVINMIFSFFDFVKPVLMVPVNHILQASAGFDLEIGRSTGGQK